jgi:hypothetical protein
MENSKQILPFSGRSSGDLNGIAPPDVEKGDRGLEDFDNEADCDLLPTNLFTTILEQRESKRDQPTWVKMFESFGARDMSYFFREGSYVVDYPKHAFLHIRYLEGVICDEIGNFDRNRNLDPSDVSKNMEKIGRLLHAHGTIYSEPSVLAGIHDSDKMQLMQFEIMR